MTKNKFFRSWKQVLSFAAICAAMALMLFLFYTSASRNITANNESASKLSVQVLDAYLNEKMDIISIESESVYNMISEGAGKEEILSFLKGNAEGYTRAIDSDFTGFYGCFSGEYIDSSGWEPDSDYVIQERPWYVAAVENKGRTAMTEPYVDAQTGKIMISVSRMLPDSEDVIAMDVTVQMLKKFASELAGSKNTHYIILDSSGMVVASSLSDEGKNYLDGSSGEDRKILAQKVQENESGHFEMRFREKTAEVFYSATEAGWRSVTVLSRADLYTNTVLSMITVSVLALVGVLFVFYYINRSELKRAEAEKSYKQAKAVSGIYVSVNEINLKTRKYDLIHQYEHVRSTLGSGEYTADEALDKVMRTLVTENYLQQVLDFVDLNTVVERLGDLKTITMEFVGKRLGWCRARFIVEAYADGGNTPYLLIFAVEDINAAKIAEEKLKEESTVDNLTGCLNRRAFDEKIKYYHDNPMEDDLVYISADVNGLKAINDELGHAAGDELIKGAAMCLKHVFGPYGEVYRTGGDEFFAIINADRDTVKQILELAEEECTNWQGKYVDTVSVSSGFARHDDNPEITISELGKLADKNMYDAKSIYYMKKGIDRRGQQDAYAAICKSYEKIILINLSDDTFKNIYVHKDELSAENGFREKYSEWSKELVNNGWIHSDDSEDYLKNMDLDFLKKYFAENDNRLYSLKYRRKIKGEYSKVLTEIVRSDKYTEKDQFVYLYVKKID